MEAIKYNYQKTKDRNCILFTDILVDDSRIQKLEPGVYNGLVAHTMMSATPTLEVLVDTDHLLNFKTGVISEIIKSAEDFFSQKTKDVFAELKLCHKFGAILYGPPGTGKTCTAILALKSLAEKYNAICINATKFNFEFTQMVCRHIRAAQDNPIIIFLDEVDQDFTREEYKWLPFLDGTDSIPGLMILGATNNIEKIPERIKSRKSRIKKLWEVKKLPLAVYKEYIKDRLPKIRKDTLDKFAYFAEEKSLTLDQLKNAIIDFRIEGISIKAAIKSAADLAPEFVDETDQEDWEELQDDEIEDSPE